MHVPDSVTKELTLSARMDHVWRALMDPELLVRWFPTEAADVDLRPGGTVRFVWESSRDEGVIDEVTPNARLVFRWRARTRNAPTRGSR